MPRGEKSKYTDKQKRKAEHIADGYKERGVPAKEAKARGWATVNKESGGGNKSGSGRGTPDSRVSSRRGGKRSHSGQGGRTTRATGSRAGSSRAGSRGGGRAQTKRATGGKRSSSRKAS